VQNPTRPILLKAVFWFLSINFLLSLGISYAYILLAPGVEGPLSTLFVHGALVSTTAMVYLLLAGVLGLATLLMPRSAVVLGLAVVLVTFLHMLNVLDIIIFRIFRYHINAMVLTLVFTEGARDSLHIGIGTVLTYAAGIAGIVGLEVLFARVSIRTLAHRQFTRRAVAAALVMSLAFIAADKACYAVADLYNLKEITRNNKVFPLYQRATIKRFARRHLGMKTDPDETLAVRYRGRILNYPREPLVRQPGGELPNIIWIVVDAWRFDMLTEEVMPNTLEFSRQALVFRNHYSGGNATRFGIFTLVYGVYGTYWHPFLAEGQSPVLLDELMKLGYDFRIISSSRLTNPEFRRTAFVNLAPYITDTLPGTMADTRDPELAKTFIRWLDTRDASRPFYAFLFMDAPHGPYIYPDEFEKFSPSNKTPNYVTAGRKDAVPLFNSYRNALFFDDHYTGMILDEVKRRGLLEDTIILITGDHGEEFFETGFWGHTSAFSSYQARVGFVLYIPGRGHGEIDYITSHHDVTPTFLKLLGYTTPPDVYSQGKDLLDPAGRVYAVVAGWDEAAIIDELYTIVLPTQSYNAGGSQVRLTQGYRLVKDERQVLRQRQGAVLEVMKDMSVFLR
jgi:membrane-anchored protein YejM (alkaline phosphatase superfamily)